MLIAVLLIIIVFSEARRQCTGGIPAAEVSAILDVHNNLRRSISDRTFVAQKRRMPAASPAIRNLKWDCAIEKSAQAATNSCVFAPSKTTANLGENLYTH